MTASDAHAVVFVQALAEKEGEGMAKMLYRKDTGEILGVHIIGLHAADLIHEASNAIATKQTVQVGATRGCDSSRQNMFLMDGQGLNGVAGS